MGTIEIIKKFIESNRIIERTVREVSEMLPYGSSMISLNRINICEQNRLEDAFLESPG